MSFFVQIEHTYEGKHCVDLVNVDHISSIARSECFGVHIRAEYIVSVVENQTTRFVPIDAAQAEQLNFKIMEERGGRWARIRLP